MFKLHNFQTTDFFATNSRAVPLKEKTQGQICDATLLYPLKNSRNILLWLCIKHIVLICDSCKSSGLQLDRMAAGTNSLD